MSGAGQRRRTAEEWAGLIRELGRSGQTPAAFARARGIRPDTLKWWRWQLASRAKATSSRPSPRRVKLVAVQPAHDIVPRDRNSATPVWELVAPTGYELRVYDRRGLSVLKAALVAVAGGRRR